MNDKLIETVGGYSWPYIIKDDGTAEITGKPSPAPEGALAIPEKLGGHIVTRIGDEALADCGELTEVTIPVGVTSIGEEAFARCSSRRRDDNRGVCVLLLQRPEVGDDSQ